MEIRRGDLLLGRYRVLDDPIVCGTTAKVWRILHTEWGRELALKQPLEQYLADPECRRGYLEECSLWVSLGLHPYIVTCYYIREIDGVPMIFCEWCGGRSLRSSLDDKSLLHTQENPLYRILRIAGQTMIALCYTHSFGGLIHGDIKPDNIMLGENDTAKLTDFSAGSVKSFTPNYMSPEQYTLLEGHDVQLSPATDVYSWALLVLELLAGQRCWRLGSDAAAQPRTLVEHILRGLPRELTAGADTSLLDSLGMLLAECLARDPRRRPQDTDAARRLCQLLSQEDDRYGMPDRSLTDHAYETADSLNNRAVSHLDLGEKEKAEACWKRALELMPMHPELFYGQSVYLWECGRLSDAQLRGRLSENCLPHKERFLHELEKLYSFELLYSAMPLEEEELYQIESIRFSEDSRYLLLVLCFPDNSYRVVVTDAMTGLPVHSDSLPSSAFPDKACLTAETGNMRLRLISEGDLIGTYYVVNAETGGQKRLLGEYFWMTFSPDGRLAAGIEEDGESITMLRTTPQCHLNYFLSKVGSAVRLAEQYAHAERLCRELADTDSLTQKLSLLEKLSGLGEIAQLSYFAEKEKLFGVCTRSHFRAAGLMMNRWMPRIARIYCSPDAHYALIEPLDSEWAVKIELIELPACRTVRRFVYHNPYLTQFCDAAFGDDGTLTLWSSQLGASMDDEPQLLRSVFDLHTMQFVTHKEPCDVMQPRPAAELPATLRDFCEENGFAFRFADISLTRLIAANQQGNLCIYRIDCDLIPRRPDKK